MNAFSDSLAFWKQLQKPIAIPYDTALIPPQQIQPEGAVPTPGTIYPQSIHALATLAGVSGDLTRPSTLKPNLAKVSTVGAVHVTAPVASALRVAEDVLDSSGNAVVDFGGEVSSVIYIKLAQSVNAITFAVAVKRKRDKSLDSTGLKFATVDFGQEATIAVQGLGVILAGSAFDGYKVWWTV